MQNKNIYNIFNIVIVFAMTMFFSCQSIKKKKQSYSISEETPIAEVFEVNLKYTDSGRLAAILKTPKILDFSNKDFAYFEFPEGVVLDIIDKEGKVSVVRSDYAISYKQTGLIDMRGNVDIKTADSTHLQAQQLYWDQNINWIFTDQPYKSYLPDGTINEADGFDANQDFTILNSRINDGVMFIKE
ncbi:LPS export ABC transporter periplasmic protein LptC [Aquimarina muelleri]|uniref:LPS export ABC transporter periplasmic protein LptC n=1 Tax=Aquimarina muelleri TaxID=279356 RepID=A0A918JWM4_9FLAO|nr:LPS export ABC transporter periplasmic protein LptC [Aquimarina muelleri]MCX2764091.1 LPS export ABC transporter periplasmic protein LptC [Aquimarina muelleri]GGX22801.1 LPS export ABC transporter periplasmic protein LptC [Aquimarina muelleri]